MEPAAVADPAQPRADSRAVVADLVRRSSEALVAAAFDRDGLDPSLAGGSLVAAALDRATASNDTDEATRWRELADLLIPLSKGLSTEVCNGMTSLAVQVHGGMGFTNELGLTEAWHSLRVVNVADGTNEILNRTIAQRLLKGDTEL